MACCQSKWSSTLSNFQIVVIVSYRLLRAGLGNDRPQAQYRWVLRVDTVDAVYVFNGRLKLRVNVVTFFCPHKILIEHMMKYFRLSSVIRYLWLIKMVVETK